ncbi:hypothetical protein [Ruminococcus albus]|uniref:Uncharacterized protein n=1 Tax=Ruminococcus albus TaxID=1264 RepID=A0A1H7IVE9_RUMAL|nr:hypothetical protein [Ruminococcus albus]SEK66378.1 hypothetical protein SAMN05216469_104116 [Ruminococcus albus]
MKTYKMIVSALAIVLSLGIMSGCGETAGEKKADDTTVTTTTTAAQTETTTTTVVVEETPEQTETEAAETPENTETESTTETTVPAEQPEVTGIVTYPDNEDGLYPMSECFRRKVEEVSGSKVVNIEFDNNMEANVAFVEDGRKFALAGIFHSEYDDSSTHSLDQFFLSTLDQVEGLDGVIVYTG